MILKIKNSEFSNTLEKKVRKNIRINKIIPKKGNILVIGDVAYYILSKIINNPSVKLIHRKRFDTRTIKKFNIVKIVTEYCLDDKIHDSLSEFFNKKKALKVIHAFESISKDELSRFAKIHNLDYKNQKNDINIFLDKLEKKHSGTKYALAKW